MPDVSSDINDLGELNLINVYPNPAGSYLKIESSGHHKVSGLSITDVTGKRYSADFDASNNTVSVSNLATGLYFCQINFENGTSITKKFLKD